MSQVKSESSIELAVPSGRCVIVAAGLEESAVHDVRRAVRRLPGEHQLLELPSLLAVLNTLRDRPVCPLVIAGIHRSLEHTISCIHGMWATHPETHVVVVADPSQESEARELLRIGCFAGLRTPPTPEDLLHVIRAAISAASGPEPEYPVGPGIIQHPDNGQAGSAKRIGRAGQGHASTPGPTNRDASASGGHHGRDEQTVRSIGPDHIPDSNDHDRPDDSGTPASKDSEVVLSWDRVDLGDDGQGIEQLRQALAEIESNLTARLLGRDMDERFRPEGPVEAPDAGGSLATSESAGHAVESGQKLGDIDLVDQLLSRPADITDMALRIVRDQSRLEDVQLLKPGTDAAIDGQRQTVEMEYAGEPLGVLTCRRDARSVIVLESWAQWLSRWLALGQHLRGMHRLAYHDELTSLYNRRYFRHFLHQILSHAAQARFNVTLMLFDIDDFKQYNDAYGHGAGDDVLIETARLMASSVRAHDIVARIGGDEFAVVFWDKEPKRLPGSRHPVDVAHAAERFQRAVCQHRFPKLADQALDRLTISAGLATFPWDGRTPDELIRVADMMLIQSKRNGKNVLTFGPGTLSAKRACEPREDSGTRGTA
ncbi:MAG: diguanylate cyclase [Phycisphaeraceae bacterium]|nr:diguanylate cyclase [Phycisphaeraceae bacterium]